MSDLISFILGRRQRLNISPGTAGTPRSPFLTDAHFIIVRNTVLRLPLHIFKGLAVSGLGCRRAPERDWW